MIPWTERASRFADTLAAEGHLPDPCWREAFAAVPRHVFVPRYIRNDESVVDGASPNDSDEWIAAIYSDTALTTQIRPAPGSDQRLPTSSSTLPSLMARMLHLLDLADGHRVLEIGTGTGYNAALLCHRLGDKDVVSIDIDLDLVDQACARLAGLGYRPHLLVGDGAGGAPVQAPFDRIIATCAIPAVPSAWIDQLRPHGLIVADIRGELSTSLAVLHKDDQTVQGRFLTIPGHFMWLRAVADNPLRDAGTMGYTINRDNASYLVTELDPAILDLPDVRFLLQHVQPAIAEIWTAERDGVQLTHLHGSNGSWAEVLNVGGGRYGVTQGGPHTLWRLAEATVHLWKQLGQPTRDRFGLTAHTDGTQRLWLDSPDQLLPQVGK